MESSKNRLPCVQRDPQYSIINMHSCHLYPVCISMNVNNVNTSYNRGSVGNVNKVIVALE